MHRLVFLDADETLWRSHNAIKPVLLRLLEDVEEKTGLSATTEDRSEFVGNITIRLAVRLGGSLSYGPEILAHVIARHLSGLTLDTALVDPGALYSGLDAGPVAKRFNTQFFHAVPELREGVIETLETFRENSISVFILTETPLKRAQHIAAQTGVGKYVDGIISHQKTPELYRYLMSTIGDENKPPLMVGDQLDRDVQFARAAGFVTAHFPGDLNPPWAPAREAARPDFTIRTFDELAAIVLAKDPPTATVATTPAVKKPAGPVARK